jgi:hypothetical protein
LAFGIEPLERQERVQFEVVVGMPGLPVGEVGETDTGRNHLQADREVVRHMHVPATIVVTPLELEEPPLA